MSDWTHSIARPHPWLASALLLSSLAFGCATSGTPGREGNVAFEYRNPDQLEGGVDTPIAAGTESDVEIDTTRGGTDEKFSVRAAESTDPEVLEVLGLEHRKHGWVVRVHAKKPGEVDLKVQTSAGSDVIGLTVQQLASIEFYHWLETLTGTSIDPSHVAFLRDGTALFALIKRGPDGEQLAGEGIDRFIEARPADAIKLEVPDEASVFFRVTAEVGDSFELGPADGDGTRAEYPVVGLDQLATLNLEPPPPGAADQAWAGASQTLAAGLETAGRYETFPRLDTLETGGGAVLLARATMDDGRRLLGLAGAVEIRSETPDHCETKLEYGLGVGLYSVEARTPGVCRVRATLGDHTAKHQFVVVDKLESGRADDIDGKK